MEKFMGRYRRGYRSYGFWLDNLNRIIRYSIEVLGISSRITSEIYLVWNFNEFHLKRSCYKMLDTLLKSGIPSESDTYGHLKHDCHIYLKIHIWTHCASCKNDREQRHRNIFAWETFVRIYAALTRVLYVKRQLGP